MPLIGAWSTGRAWGLWVSKPITENAEAFMNLRRLAASLKAARGSVLSSWLRSYLLLLLLPIALSAVVYLMGQGAIEAELGRLHGAVLDQLRIAGDAALQDVRRTAYQIGVNNNLKVLINKDISYRDVDPYTLVALYSELGRIKLFSDYVDEFIIHVRNIDQILTITGLVDPEQYFALAHHGLVNATDAGYRTWHAALLARHTAECIPVLEASDGNVVRQKVIYMQSLPLDPTSPVDATIVMTVSMAKFERILQYVQSINGSQAMVVDGENRIMFSTIGPYDRPSPLGPPARPDAAGTTRTRVDGVSVVASYVSSRVADWRYVSLVPESTIGERLRSLRLVASACLLLCLLGGSAGAYLFARKNYAPVARLVRFLGQRAGARPDGFGAGNEYRFLQDTMGTVLSQNEDFRRRLQLQNAALKRSFLSRLLTGAALEHGEYVDSALATFGIHFESSSFVVLLFYISGPAQPVGEPGRDRDAGQVVPLRSAIEQIIEELAAGLVIAQVTEVDEMIGCLVNAKQGRVAEARLDAIRLATEARASVRDRLGVTVKVSASAVHPTLVEAPTAYREALGVMEYKVAMEDDEAFGYDEIPLTAASYNYSMAAELHLVNHVKAGDATAATAVIDEVFESRFVRTSMSIDLIKCLVFDVVGTILKTLPEINALPDTRSLQDLNVFSRLAGCVTVQEMKQQIKDIVEIVCAQVREHRTSRGDRLEGSIIALVKERLGDWNLSVRSIADHFQLSSAYVAKVFRDQAGQGLGEYISETRMETAKLLLSSQDLDIKDVAARVGYIHSSVFIRAFKKHEGVTPGQFRETAKTVTRDLGGGASTGPGRPTPT